MKIAVFSHFTVGKLRWLHIVLLSIVSVCLAGLITRDLNAILTANVAGIYLQRALNAKSQAVDKAQKWLTRAISLNSVNATAYRFRGILDIKLGNYQAAKTALDQALAINSNDLSAQILMGDMYYAQGQFEKAMEVWHQFGASQRLLSLGDEFSDEMLWSEAVSAYQYAFDLIDNPDSTIYRHLAWAQWKATGDADAAINLLDKGMMIWSDDVWLMIYTGRIYTDLEEFDAAQLWYNRARQVSPDLFNVWLGLGNQAFESKNFTLAIEYYVTALGMQPDFAPGYYNLGLAYEQLKQYQEALEAFQNAVHLDPSKPWYHNALAKISRDLGMYNEAIMEYQQTLVIDPENKTAQQALVKLCAGHTDIEACEDGN